MAEFKQTATNQEYTLGANDSVDLGQDFYTVWVYGPGGTVNVAPGEAASTSGGAARLYGAVSPAANTWERITPDFPTRYLQFITAGTWTVHRTDPSGRRTGRG